MSFIEKAFETAVLFSAIDNMTAPLRSMGKQLGILDKQSKEVQKTLAEFKTLTMAGGAITSFGIKMADSMEIGVNKAGEFLTKMEVVKNTVGATTTEMQKLEKASRNASLPTSFGLQDTTQFAMQMATSGYDANQITSLLPSIAKYADVMKLGKGAEASESVKEIIEGSHALGIYDPKELEPFLNKYYKAVFMQPGGPSQFAETMKYLAPKGSAVGMSTDDILTLSAMSNRMGLAGSMGGTHAADMILRAIPGLLGGRSTKKDSKQVAAMKELGLYSSIYDESGNFKGISNFIDQLGIASKGRKKTDLARLYHDMFGAQGMDLAMLLSGEKGQEQLQAIRKNMSKSVDLNTMQQNLNNTPQGQIMQLEENIENLKLGVWIELAKILNPIFMWLNNIVGKIQEFADAHPKISKYAATFMLIATAAALIIGPILTIIGAFGFLKASGTFGVIASSAATVLPIIGIVIAALAALVGIGYLVYKNWDKIKPVLISIWKSVFKEIEPIVTRIKTDIINAFNVVVAWVKENWPTIKIVIMPVINFIKAYILSQVWSLVTLLQAAWYVIKATIKVVWDLIVTITKVSWDILSGIITIGLDLLTGNWDKAWEDFQKLVDNVWIHLKEGFWSIISDFKQLGSDLMTALSDGIKRMMGAPLSALKDTWNSLKSFGGLIDSNTNKSSAPTGAIAGSIAYSKAMGTSHHAWGGWVTRRTYSELAEDGSEVVIPMSHKDRALSLYRQVGDELGANGGGGITVAPGAIVINTHPNHDEELIANRVIRKLGKIAPRVSRSRGNNPVAAW